MRPGLVVSDLDGTLLRRGAVLSPRSMKALLALRAMGIPFAVATARSRHTVDRLLPDGLEPDAYITSGGALAYVGAEQIFARLLPADRADALSLAFHALHEEGKVKQITLHSPAGDFTNVPKVSPRRMLHNHCYTDFSQPLGQAAMSLNVRTDCPEALEGIQADFPELDHLRYRGEKLHRFAHPEANKGTALAAVCAHLGVDIGNALAFGDDVNDRALLLAAGHSVAMADSPVDILEIADEICPSVERDGVARYLEKRVIGSPLRRWLAGLRPGRPDAAAEQGEKEERERNAVPEEDGSAAKNVNRSADIDTAPENDAENEASSGEAAANEEKTDEEK